MRYTLVKFGGAVITDKSKAFVLREKVMQRLAREFVEGVDNRYAGFVLGNGAGSFGHGLAKKYKEDLGDVNSERGEEGFGLIKEAVRRLNRRFCEGLEDEGVDALGMEFDGDVLKRVLEEKGVVVLHGDIVRNEKEGRFEIWSTERIFDFLVKGLEVERVILVTSVDGVLDGEGKLVEVIDESWRGEAGDFEVEGVDVTGGMRSKLEYAQKWAELGVETVILNGFVEGRLKDCLEGKMVVGTRVRSS